VSLLGGVEAGGTRFVCAIGPSPERIERRVEIPTTDPATTIARVIEFFRESGSGRCVDAMGIGSFGPLDLGRGVITSTPKSGWSNIAIAGLIGEALGVEVRLDTDVNAAAIAESRWGVAKGHDSFVYLTVGTGIGGAAQVDGQLLHGPAHPEMGHMRLPHDVADDPFAGSCPFHGDCWEGLASGQAIRERWHGDGASLGERSEVWQLEANYLAAGIANLVYVLSPEVVIVGGGVMNHRGLLALVRERLTSLHGGYGAAQKESGFFLVAPGLGAQAGVMGALALAQGISGDKVEVH
jgi:fructokinase